MELGNCSPHKQSCVLTFPAAPNSTWQTPGATIGAGQPIVRLTGIKKGTYETGWGVAQPSAAAVALGGIKKGTYTAGATVVQPPPSYYPPNKVPPATGTVATTVENSTTVVVIVTSATVSGYTPKFTPGPQAAPVKIDDKPVGTPKTVSDKGTAAGAVGTVAGFRGGTFENRATVDVIVTANTFSAGAGAPDVTITGGGKNQNVGPPSTALVSGITGCGTGKNTVNLGAQLFQQYDVIINVQTPQWWEDHIMKPGVTLDGINLGTYRAGATVVQPPPSYYPPNKVPPATGTVATTVENSTTVVVIVTSATVSGYTPKFTAGLNAAPVKIDGLDGKPVDVGTPKTVSGGQPPPSPWNLYPCQAPSWVHADLPGRPPLVSDTSGNRFQIGFKRPCPCTTATSPCPPPGYPGACCLSDTQSAPCETQNWTKETCVPPLGTWCDASTTEDYH